jgi:hypothetical protein
MDRGNDPVLKRQKRVEAIGVVLGMVIAAWLVCVVYFGDLRFLQ